MTFKFQEQQVYRGGGALRRRRPGWRLWWPSELADLCKCEKRPPETCSRGRPARKEQLSQEKGGDAVAHRRARWERDQDGGFGGHRTGGQTGTSEGEATEDLCSLRSKFGAFYTHLLDRIVQTTCFLIGHLMI